MYTVPDKLRDFSLEVLNQLLQEVQRGLEEEVQSVHDSVAWEAFKRRWLDDDTGIFYQLWNLAKDSWFPHLSADEGQNVRLAFHVIGQIVFEKVEGQRKYVRAVETLQEAFRKEREGHP